MMQARSEPHGAETRAGRTGWVALAALLALGAIVVFMAAGASAGSAQHLAAMRSSGLALEPAQGFMQGAHRWFTASWAHWSWTHLLFNLVGAYLVAWLGWVARVGRADVAAWAVAWPLSLVLVMLLFWLAPFAATLTTHLGGLSGVLHAGVAVVAVSLLVAARPQGKAEEGARAVVANAQDTSRRRWIGAALLLGLGLKLGLELALGPTQWSAQVRTEPWLHVGGTLAGLLCAATARLVARPAVT